MNRPTAILVALATLLAHVLALHQNVEGTFAPPFELAHVAFREARNLVYDGSLAWNTGGPVIESYPSTLWVALNALATALYLPPTVTSQYVGIACALGTVAVLAQFSANRLAGLIALLLFVVTGTTASAAASGTEYPLVMLAVSAAFLFYERRWPRALAIALTLLVLTRNDLWLFVLAFLAFELLGARRRRAAGEPTLLRAFLVPFGAMAAAALLRWLLTGVFLSSTTRLLLTLNPERWRLGRDYVVSFYLCSGAGFLVVFPLWYLLRRQLSGAGRRALALVGLWSVFIALVGGDGLPFWMALAPAVPLLFLAVQEAMIIAMDSRRRALAPLTWLLFVGGVVGSGLVSRVPTDIGSLPLEHIQRLWMRPTDRLIAAYGRMHGRLGLMQEIDEVEEMRAVGVFLRDRLDVGSRILSPWPGAIGYISRQEVLDLFGRASAPADGSPPRSWYGLPEINIPSSLSVGAEYIVPVATSGTVPPRIGELLRSWIERHEPPETRAGSIVPSMARLRTYELISVPIPRRSYLPADISPHPFYMLRRRDLELEPRLELRSAGDRTVDVFAWHDGHEQVVDLEVVLVEPNGRSLHLRPTGDFVEQDLVHARAAVLLHRTGEQAIHLMRFRVPDDVQAGELLAILQNPNSGEDAQFSMVSKQASLKLADLSKSK